MYAFDVWLMCDYEKCANSCQKVPIMFILCLHQQNMIYFVYQYTVDFMKTMKTMIYMQSMYIFWLECVYEPWNTSCCTFLNPQSIIFMYIDSYHG